MAEQGKSLHFALILLVFLASVSQGKTKDLGSGQVVITDADRASVSGYRSRTLAANKGVHCVSYYAKLVGDHGRYRVGHLKTSVVDADTGTVISDEEHVADVVGKEATLVYFDIPEQTKPFQVVIKKIEHDDEKNVEVVILDAEVDTGTCLVKDASCNFERGGCGYTAKNEQWAVDTPSRSDFDGHGYPLVDATLGSDNGQFVVTKVTSKGPEPVLFSSIIRSKVACVRFQYAIYGGAKISVSKKESRTVLHAVSNRDPQRKETHPKWRSTQVTIEESEEETFRLAFTVHASSSGEESMVAMDDIQVVNHGCSMYDGPTHHPAPRVIQEASCDFDGDCDSDWIPETKENSSLVWKLTTGKGRARPPTFDHTNLDAHSNFQYIYVWKKSQKTIRALTGPQFSLPPERDTTSTCFSFWYFMHGVNVPQLSAYFRWTGNSQSGPLWTRKGSQGPEWKQAFVHAPDPGKNKAYIEFSVINTQTGSVAIDDVIMYDGPCPDQGAVCDFEVDMCGFKSPSRVWTRGMASKLESVTGMSTDRSTNTPSGSFVYIDDRFKDNPQPALLSPMYPPTAGRCLKFFYSVSKNTESKIALEVFRLSESGNAYTIDELSGLGRQDKWSFAETNVVSNTNFKIAFLGTPHGGVVSLDDIQLSTSACTDSYGCDFEQGLCAWSTSLDDHSNLDWQVTSGHLIKDETVPDKDVTMNTPFGHFLYLQTSEPAEPGDIAVLTSQEMAFGSCLTFFYSMMGDGVGSLAVNLTNLGDDMVSETIWEKSGTQGRFPPWQRAEVDLYAQVIRSNDEMIEDFQLSLIGTVGSVPGSDIAVDEIKVHFERCSNVKHDEMLMVTCRESETGQKIRRSQLCDFQVDCEHGEDEEHCGTCDFGPSKGWCNYVEQSRGEQIWAVSSDVPISQLEEIPSRRGHFLLVSRRDPPHGPQIFADLETGIEIGPSPPSCQLRFSYFISSKDPEQAPLRVLLRQSDEETVIFSRGKAKGYSYQRSWEKREPTWSTANVDIGGIDSRFKLVFLGHKKFGQENEIHVAIDDIELKNCEFSPVVDSCKPTEFRCDRGSCVDSSRVCDFTDDCGDQSDERDCESKQVRLRTSFEDGFGDWTVDTDNWVKPWKIYQAKEGVENPVQPTRDHTLGTLNGHFAHTQHFDPNKKHPARILSPVVVSANDLDKCHLRLHYYLHAGNEHTHLRVATKTSELGEEAVIFHRFTSHGHVWTRADIEIEETSKPFQIIISGTADVYHRGTYLAIDDISLWGCEFANETLPEGAAVTPNTTCTDRKYLCDDGTCLERWQVGLCDFINHCPDGTDEKQCGDCDFESGACGWHDESVGVLSWRLRASSQQREPSSDSTKDTEGQGHYMFLRGHSAGVDKTPAQLFSNVLPEADPRCALSFSYYTNSHNTESALKVISQNANAAGTEEYLVIPRGRSVRAVPGQWTRFKVNLGASVVGGSRIIITQEYFDIDDSAAVAIDDIKFENCLRRGAMRKRNDVIEALECNFFEKLSPGIQSFCNYHPSYLQGSFFWQLSQATGLDGKLIGVARAGAWDGSQVGHEAFLTSEWIDGSDTPLCIQFMYMTFGTTLRVRLRTKDNQWGFVIFNDHSYDYKWKMGQTGIHAIDQPFMIEFDAVVGHHAREVYLASIFVSQDQCLPSARCDFFLDKCGYVEEPANSWRRSLPGPGHRFPMPKVDRTSDDSYGRYMYVRGSESQTTSTLTSPEKTQDPDQGSCVYFWYNMIGPQAGQLTVMLDRDSSTRTTRLWRSKVELQDQWLQERVDIPKDVDKYRLVFEATMEGQKLFALDDIETVKGACPHPGTCNFDVDMCGYTSHTFNNDNSEVISEARWIWLVSDMPMSRYGPMADHTDRQDNGGFAFSDQFIRLFINSEELTRMVSPMIPPTEQACLTFWYFFNGRGSGTLRVKIGDQMLFQGSSKSKNWQKATPVQISSAERFQITFESTRVGHEEASMAVDDIVVAEGPCDADHHVPLIPHVPKPTPADKPKVVTTPRVVQGHGSAADDLNKLDCNTKCKHWQSCKVGKKNYVECICEPGWEGESCDRPKKVAKEDPYRPVGQDTQKPRPRPKQVVDPDTKLKGGATMADRQKKKDANYWQTPVAIIVAILVVVVVFAVVFVILVKTDRLRAPSTLQRMFPYLKPEEGFNNPSVRFTSNNEVGITNPVYGPYEGNESEI